MLLSTAATLRSAARVFQTAAPVILMTAPDIQTSARVIFFAAPNI
jgi:hypothetical protein